MVHMKLRKILVSTTYQSLYEFQKKSGQRHRHQITCLSPSTTTVSKQTKLNILNKIEICMDLFTAPVASDVV